MISFGIALACWRLPDLRALFTGSTDAFGFFRPSLGFRGTFFSITVCFPHLGQGTLPKLDHVHHGRDYQRRVAVRALDGKFREGQFDASPCPGIGRFLFARCDGIE
ncbi:MAG TPA: hypothetical protein VK828_16840 [Terriglobales bacterium]|jgi:hypothetical protein|nr:hypothetical protein [Terriglobales bacterium]